MHDAMCTIWRGTTWLLWAFTCRTACNLRAGRIKVFFLQPHKRLLGWLDKRWYASGEIKEYLSYFHLLIWYLWASHHLSKEANAHTMGIYTHTCLWHIPKSRRTLKSFRGLFFVPTGLCMQHYTFQTEYSQQNKLNKPSHVEHECSSHTFAKRLGEGLLCWYAVVACFKEVPAEQDSSCRRKAAIHENLKTQETQRKPEALTHFET